MSVVKVFLIIPITELLVIQILAKIAPVSWKVCSWSSAVKALRLEGA